MLITNKYLITFLLIIILAVLSFSPRAQAADPVVQSQMLTSTITVTDTTGFTIKGSIELNNNSTKGFDNNSLVIKLLQPSKPVETTIDGKIVSRTPQALIIDYQKTASISLTPGQKINQPFNLRYPALIENGDYILVAELQDQDSSSQSIASQNIALNGNGGFLLINSESCTVTIGTTTYSSNEGPTIQKNQRGTASCTVRNTGQTKVEARLQVPYAPYSVTNNVGNLERVDTNNQIISFEPNQDRKVAFTLPTNIEPTVYEALLQIVDASGQKVSVNIPFRWIIPGESAKVKNFDSDKTYYKQGEVAKISANILGSADTGWRGGISEGQFAPDAGTDLIGSKATIRITDDKGQLCGEKTTELPSTKDKSWNDFTFDVPINTDCKNPKVEGKILSSTDKILDEVVKQTTSTDSDLKKAGIVTPAQKAKNTTWFLIAGIILLLIIATAIIFFVIRRRKTSPPTSSPQPPIPPATIVSTIILVIATSSVITGLKLGILTVEFPVHVSEVSAQQATVKTPINSTAVDVQNVVMEPSNSRPIQSFYSVWTNVRDFVEKGGDSRVTIAPNCDKIEVTVSGSAGSGNSCENWGTGLPMAAYIDGQPSSLSNVSSPTGNEIFRSVPGIPGDNAVNIVQFAASSGQRAGAFTLIPTAAQKLGEHTLTIRVGSGYIVRHQGNIEDNHTTFENLPNCNGVTGPCYMELKHVFTCPVPKACNEECASSIECRGNTQGCTECRDNGAGKKTCQPPPACNAQCATTEDCASNLAGCTTCRPDPTGAKTCQPAPPQCNAACSGDRDCFGGLNGCNTCVEGSCKKPPACGTQCTTQLGCEAAKDGCNTCVSGTCRVQPSCGTACITKADCAGAKEGCSECLEGTCTNFKEEMCSCDGFEATQLEYPSTKPFSFSAFAKVENGDIAKALVEGIQFRMSESDASDPNGGKIVAQSPMYTPSLVEQSGTKMRYKATWDLTPPEIKKGKLYRVFSEIKCKPKKITQIVDASDPHQYQSRVAGVSTANAAEGEIGVSKEDLQLKTLNLIKKGETDKCKYLFFQYDAGL